MIAWHIRFAIVFGFISATVFCQTSISADTDSEGEKFISSGDSLRKIGQYTEALESYHSGKQIFQFKNNLRGEAHALRGIGMVYYYQAIYDTALEYWENAHRLYLEIGDKKYEGKILNNFGLLYSNRGDYEKAIEYFHLSLALARELGDMPEEGISLQNLGNVYLRQSDYPHALLNYQHSLRIFREIENRQYEMITMLTTGSVYLYLSDYSKAFEYYQTSLLIARELGDRNIESQAMNNLGLAHSSLQEHEEALKCYQHSLALCRELGNRNGEGNSLNNIGVLYSELEDYQNALEYYRESLSVFRDLGDKIGEGSNLLNIGGIYSRIGKYQEGLESIQTGLTIAKDLGAEHSVQAGYLEMGDCYLAQGQISQARENYTKAIATIEGIRGKLEVEAQKSSYASGVFSVYEKMVTSLLVDNRVEEAFNYVERGRARTFLDILGGEIQVEKSTHEEFLKGDEDGEEYEPELKTMNSQNPLTLSEVQKLLDPKSTLLEYFLTENNMLVWAISCEDVDVVEINITADSLRCLVDSFRETIRRRGSTDYLSWELYKVLIEPVLDKIGTESLIIIPHGILHYLPFQALNNRDGIYLFEQYQISYLPSASVIKYLPQKRHDMSNRVLAFGNPAIVREEFGSIEFSKDEVKRIGKVFSNSVVYTDSLASESVFREQAPGFDILHLACHAELNSSYPMFSGLLLAPGGGYDGELDVHEIFSMELDASLVVLSACQTGLGQLTTGDELVGLSRAFLSTGTQSLVSSLWTVYDESTGYFMECFYRNLQSHSKVEALQMAQIDTKEKYKDIYYWAPFVLIGAID